MRIAVAIPTLHRPVGLERALRSVAAQRFDADAPELTAVVVNNDPSDGRPRDVVLRVARETALRIELLDEERPGVAAARNRALRWAKDAAEIVAFIDDDEEAPPLWLGELLAVKRRYAADVVTGTVHPRFAVPPPSWIVEGGFFVRPIRATGALRPWAFTGNVLFDVALLDRLPRWFDERFRQGEDREFFTRLAATGARIVWAADHAPIEDVPPERMSEEWLVSRMRAVGRSLAIIAVDRRGAAIAVPLSLAKAAVWSGLGAGTLLAGSVAGKASRVRGRRWLGYAAGLARGAFTAGRRHPPPQPPAAPPAAPR